jgi:hypothetical protein
MPWRHPALSFPPTPGKSEAGMRAEGVSGCHCLASIAPARAALVTVISE